MCNYASIVESNGCVLEGGTRCSFAPVETHCSEGFVLDSWYLNFLVPFSEKITSHRVNTYYAAVVQRRSRHEEKGKRVDSTSPFFSSMKYGQVIFIQLLFYYTIALSADASAD